MAAPTSPELLALQQVTAGRFSVDREIGRGGMGIVFLARDVALERPVAIKLLPPQFSGNADMRERFVREARTAARLSHPNIVPIHSVEEHGDIVFFVMAFVDGETLTGRVRRAGPLNAREGSKLVQEIAWALAYAHSAGIVHRDVKPDNVLIERATSRAMLTDFGIARVADASGITARGAVMGTAQFVSPEQASGGAVDARSDLYSLGVTAFYALAGRLPFEAPTLVGLLGMHLMQPAPPLATVRRGLPPKLASAVDRCLAKSPSDRFTTGEQLAEAIADARGNEVDVPPIIRSFLRDRTRTLYEVGAYYAALMFLGAFSGMPAATLILPLAGLAAISVVGLLNSARRVLKSGFVFADVRAALIGESATRREELGLSEPSHEERTRAKRVMQERAGSLGLTGFGLMVFAGKIFHGPASVQQAITGLGLGVAVIGLVLLARNLREATRNPIVKPVPGVVGRVWLGRFGERFFALAGFHLDVYGWDNELRPRKRPRALLKPALSTATDVLLAKAARDLFSSLPSSARTKLAGGREIVDRLQGRITRLRDREEQLDAAIAEAGPPASRAGPPGRGAAGDALAARRSALVSDLEQARAAAASRRASAVAALENIRLQLLRLQSGLGTPDDLTADLDAAAALEREIGIMVDAYTEAR